jgi:hypothetical protein
LSSIAASNPCLKQETKPSKSLNLALFSSIITESLSIAAIYRLSIFPDPGGPTSTLCEFGLKNILESLKTLLGPSGESMNASSI